MYENLNSSFLLWNKLHLYFVTFLLPVSILTLLFLSPTSINKPLAATFIHSWSLRWQILANYNSKPCFAFFFDCATLSLISFLNSLITRAPPSGTLCHYQMLAIVLDFGVILSFYYLTINKNWNDFIKLRPPWYNTPFIPGMYIDIRKTLCKWSLVSRGGGAMLQRQKSENMTIWPWLCYKNNCPLTVSLQFLTWKLINYFHSF